MESPNNLHEKYIITEGPDPKIFVLFDTGWSTLSNFNPICFTIGGTTYRSVQQYINAQKAIFIKRPDLCNAIMQTYSPRKCFDIMAPFENYLPSAWAKESLKHYKLALRAKFYQHPELRQYLLLTGSAYIIFSSVQDQFLGSGFPMNHADCTNVEKFPGKNWLGKMLMKVREEMGKLPNSSPEPPTTEPIVPKIEEDI